MSDDNSTKTVDIDTSAIIDKVSADVKEKVGAELADDLTRTVSPKISEQVSKDVTEKIVQSIQGKTGPQSDAPWAKEGRTPKSYEEVAEYGKQKAIEEMKKVLEEREKAQEEKTRKMSEEEKDRAKKWDEYWDRQITKLTQEGKIPAPVSFKVYN